MPKPPPKASAQQTLLRQWTMLQAIPCLPQKISTRELESRLAEADFKVDVRTIQRDLQRLSSILPLLCDDARPAGWSWREPAMQRTIPGMEPHVALTFVMAHSYLQQLLPKSTVDRLKPLFLTAQGVLEKHPGSISTWPEKVRVLPRGMPQAPLLIDQQVEAVVYRALLEERQLVIDYSRGGDNLRRYQVSPLAVVVRDRSIYLVCRFAGHDDVRQLALQRIRQAEVSLDEAVAPADFSIDDYIASGEFGIVFDSERMPLEVLLRSHLEIHLREQPIADDQQIEGVDDNWFRLTATVANNLETRLWLQSFGAEAEILGPPELRAEFARNARRLARRYRGS